VVYFDTADSVFEQAENLKAPAVLRLDTANGDYQTNIQQGTGVASSSLACVPLLSGDVTTGTMGFVKFGDREWLPGELNALQTIATLFAQLQARLLAEEQLRYLVEHDDHTGLVNRRVVVAHLDGRLAEGQPGPVSVLYLDIDRLKVINDHLGHSSGDRFLKAFAELLCQATDVPSVIARFAGDEFVVVPTVPMDVERAEALAQWLQNRVRRQVEIDGEMLSRTVRPLCPPRVRAAVRSHGSARKCPRSTRFVTTSNCNWKGLSTAMAAPSCCITFRSLTCAPVKSSGPRR
jgi:diguanylate cyclase (GGDEF)-like protein